MGTPPQTSRLWGAKPLKSCFENRVNAKKFGAREFPVETPFVGYTGRKKQAVLVKRDSMGGREMIVGKPNLKEKSLKGERGGPGWCGGKGLVLRERPAG